MYKKGNKRHPKYSTTDRVQHFLQAKEQLLKSIPSLEDHLHGNSALKASFGGFVKDTPFDRVHPERIKCDLPRLATVGPKRISWKLQVFMDGQAMKGYAQPVNEYVRADFSADPRVPVQERNAAQDCLRAPEGLNLNLTRGVRTQ